MATRSDPAAHHDPRLGAVAHALRLSRRRILVSSGLVAAASVSGLVPGLVRVAGAEAADPLTARTFRPLSGRSFRFTGRSGAAVTLRLDAVEGVGRAAAAEHSFSLRFSGPVAPRQGGEVGTLQGPGLAPMRLLVVPSGRAHPRGQDWIVTVLTTRGADDHD